MKILYVGYHNPSFVNSTVYREEAIKALGNELVSFDDRAYVLPGRLRKRFPALKNWDVRRLNNNLVQAASKEGPEACFVVGGQGILPETLDKLRGIGIKTVLWTSDAPISYSTPTAEPRDFDIIIKAAPFYDHVFCAGSEAVELLAQEGVKAEWLPFACDPDYQHPVELTEEERLKYQRDIVFVGSYYKNREKTLETLSDMNIGIWGPNWSKISKSSPLKDSVHDLRIGPEEWVKIYSASRIVLVVNYDDGKTLSNQVSPKLYEAMACGSFVIVDSKPDAKALFRDKEEVVFYDGEKDLKEKVQYYLDNADERITIAHQGYKTVLKKHTYEDRIKIILKKVFEGK